MNNIVMVVAVVVIVAFVARGRCFVFSFLGWLYLARVSVIALAVFGGLPLAAQSAGRSLCIGAFDLRADNGSILVGLLLPIAAWAIFLTGAMVFAYGARRSHFDLAPPPEWILRVLRIALAFALVLNIWTIIGATELSRSSVLSRLAIGLLIGGIVVWSLEEWHRRNRGTWLGGNLYLLPHPGEEVRLGEVWSRQVHPDVDDGRSWLLRGYREHDADGKWHFVPGHKLLLLISLLFLVINILIAMVEWSYTGDLTAIVYLLVLLITVVLVSGGVAFFLDAYRIPFMTVCVAWLILAGQMEDADHFYRIWPRDDGAAKSSEVATPAQILAEAGRAGRPIVLVAIAGGGIQSAAWATRVLTGLEEEVIEAKKNDPKLAALPDFAGSVQCLSGVSGGSTGAMFFVAGYGEEGLPAPRPSSTMPPRVNSGILTGIVAAAEASSLGQATWGLAYPDLLRSWLPFGVQDPYLDRAEKMERKWAYNASQGMGALGEPLKRCSLADWQRDVREGKRPAIIFNGTIVETGERLSFSTAPVRSSYGGQREFVSFGPKNELDPQLCPGGDLLITTAARLSATFPVISPSARHRLGVGPNDNVGTRQPNADLLRSVTGKNALRHVVDGGYYENTGMGALVQWVDNGLTDLSEKKKPEYLKYSEYWPQSILVIQIDGFPTPSADATGTRQPSDVMGQGTIFQIASPLAALYNVRGAGHTASATRAFEMLQKRWLLTDKPKLEGGDPVEPSPTCYIKLVRFTIPLVTDSHTKKWWKPEWPADPKQPPLSWHLRQTEKEGIEEAWQALRCEARIHRSIQPQDGDKPPISPSSGKDEFDPGAWPVDNVLDFLATPPPPRMSGP